MDVSGRRIWQVAAGDADRNYTDLCLEWDVILNGPGSEGPWPDCAEALRFDWGLSPRKLDDLQRFCEELKDGDLVVLRIGTADVYGVGEVVGDYLWHEEFGDVDGWGLQHTRRVRWLWRYEKVLQRFDTYTLKLGDTVQVMDSKPVLDWLAGLPVDQSAFERPLRELPPPSKDSEWNEVSEYLFDHGVSSGVIRQLSNEIDELVRIARWYQRTGGPSEAETTAYLVVPLLRALGWTPQKMAVGWSGVDLALFSALPRRDEHLAAIVEVKAKDRSCLTARSQAQSYAEQPSRGSCTRLIVTDGLRYGVYLRKDGTFGDKPDAYLNLTRMRDAYPVLGCGGTKEVLLFMAAGWA